MKQYPLAFLIPIGNIVSGKNFGCFLRLQAFAAKYGFPILTICGRTHVDARNSLATMYKGFTDPEFLVKKVDNFIWIDADQFFTIEQVETLINCNHPFCAGWYIKDNQGRIVNSAMAALWREEFFVKHGNMDFLRGDYIESQTKLIQVDYTGFGFVKTHTSLFEALEYPYFRNRVVKVQNYQDNCSEDVSFCLDVVERTNIKPVVIPELRIQHVKEIMI